MKYQKLRIFSYNHPNELEGEYKNRLNNLTTFKTDLMLTPYSVTKGERVINEKYPLFYMPLPLNLILEDKILRNSKKIQNEFEELTPIAQDKMLFNHIIKEIQSSNEIEGVRSTKKELQEAAKFKDTKTKIRFKGIVSQYLRISDSKYEKIEKVEDFRAIYDMLFLDDVEIDELPDGKLFRKDTVYIQGDNGSVHQGASDEQLIISDLEALIRFMNSESYPILLKSAISHYFFEYIHPFYDGNGRLGRFILSSYLARKIDKFTGVSFSNAVRENRQKYLKSFNEVSNPKNKGDITHFVQNLYELVIEGQEQLIDNLIEYQARFEHATGYMESRTELTKEEKKIIFIYIQNYLFGDFSEIEDREMSELQNVTMPTLKKRMAPLIDKKMIVQTKKRPSVHNLSEYFLEDMNNY